MVAFGEGRVTVVQVAVTGGATETGANLTPETPAEETISHGQPRVSVSVAVNLLHTLPLSEHWIMDCCLLQRTQVKVES